MSLQQQHHRQKRNRLVRFSKEQSKQLAAATKNATSRWCCVSKDNPLQLSGSQTLFLSARLVPAMLHVALLTRVSLSAPVQYIPFV